LALLPTDLTNIVSEAGFIHAINISKYEPAHTPGAQLLERYAIGNFPACALPNLLPLVFRSLASQSTKSRHISAAFSYKSAKIVSAHPPADASPNRNLPLGCIGPIQRSGLQHQDVTAAPSREKLNFVFPRTDF
jgi:hypothetical protein